MIPRTIIRILNINYLEMEENQSDPLGTNQVIELANTPTNRRVLEPTQRSNEDSNRELPQVNGKNCLQQIFFTWVYQLLAKAQTEDLRVGSTPSLPTHLRAEHEFQAYLSNRKEYEQMGLFSMLLKVFGGELLRLVILSIVVEAFYLSYPVLIYFNVDYLQNHREDLNYGIILFAITILVSFMYNLTYTNLKYRFKSLGVNISTHLNLLIFHKSLGYSLVGEKTFGQGDIIGYSQIDTDNMMYIGSKLMYFIFGIIEVFAGFGLLYWFVGTAFIAGVIVLLTLSTLTFLISLYGVEATDRALESRDQRLASTSELLNIIRFIKLNAMEKFFYKKIQAKREEELMNFKRKGVIEILLVFLYYITAPLLLTATIVTYMVINQTIDPAKVFTTMMVAVIFEVTALELPKASSQLLSVLKSIDRINAFLQAPEIDKRNYQHNPHSSDSSFAITINNGDFFIRSDLNDIKKISERLNEKNNANPEMEVYIHTNPIQKQSPIDVIINLEEATPRLGGESTERRFQSEDSPKDEVPILKNINLKIEKGKLYMIFGDIGSGKSMLLLSILNELNKKEHSTIQINGKVAFVSQKPWIFSGTVEENIVFTFGINEPLLEETIKYSCLIDDIKQMPNGKKTQIGEHGINLSGGQRFRVDLARSLYSKSDIYLYDDVLSAVDIHVGTFIMEETIKEYLKGKTILMATHAIKFAEKADYIILMKGGEVVACDTYQNITKVPQFHEIQMKIREREQEKSVLQQEVDSIIELVLEDEEYERIAEASSERPPATQSENMQLIEELVIPEDQEKGEVDIKIFKQYIKLNGGYCSFFFIIILCFLIYSALQTTASILLSIWASNDGDNRNLLYIFIALTISANLFIFAEAVVLLLSGVKQGRQVHQNIIKGLLYASLTNFFNRVPMGRLLNRMGKDLKQLDQVIANTLSSSLIAFFRILSALFICIYTSTPFALIPIVIVGIIFVKIRSFYIKGQTKIIRLEKITNSPLVISFTNGIRGATSIRSYTSCQSFLQNHIDFVNNYKQILFNHYAISGWFILVLVYLGYIVNMFCIGYAMFSKNSNPAEMGLLLAYILNLNDELFQFVLDEADFQTQLISLERLYNFMNLAPERRYEEYCLNWNEEEECLSHMITQGSIEFRHASARYRADLPRVINDVSCKIKSGEKVGIVGRTGSGKTTILNTIIGITELSQGDILIDNIKISQMHLKSLRKEITVIDQEPVIIHSTFRQNLDLFGQYSDEELNRMIEECNISEIVDRRGGLDGIISNDSLSAGEKQLTCICRALLKNSRIVLIDEATANVDVKNDAKIQNVIEEKFVGKTVLTIAHRLSTLANCDKIMVMEGGKLLEFGSPKELQEKQGIYFEMIKKYQSMNEVQQ